ncbi:Protein of unknown function [Pyronema omphalodes CBS 100304]|uniref:Uncharacterized protein n=1 Tax=Pyronema omphalodes (strain CBS 100304) TaxID=1076935 RepID=U4LIL6_PYROM|nr:Protein of unknown function [Pyronema omphalodes CBS 100304]
MTPSPPPPPIPRGSKISPHYILLAISHSVVQHKLPYTSSGGFKFSLESSGWRLLTVKAFQIRSSDIFRMSTFTTNQRRLNAILTCHL